MNIKIVYFSGTGGTAFAAKILSKNLTSKNIKNGVFEIFQDNLPSVDKCDIVVLMFPVYACDAPYPIYKWISTIPKSDGKKAVVISVSGGGEITPNTACRTKVINLLEKKEFSVNNEYMICMPSNFITGTQEHLAAKLIEILPKKCEIIVNEITKGIDRRKKAYIKDKIIKALCKAEKIGSRFFGRTIKANKNCNACGICAKNCPVGNIKMDNNVPKFGWKCALCVRCIYACPQKALSPLIMKLFIIKEGYNIDLIIENAKTVSQTEDIKLPASKLWSGVNKYIFDIDCV